MYFSGKASASDTVACQYCAKGKQKSYHFTMTKTKIYFLSLAFSNDTQKDNKRITLKAMRERVEKGDMKGEKLNLYMSHVESCSCSRLISTEYSEDATVKFNRPTAVIEPGLSLYAGED